MVGFHGGLYDALTKLVHFTQRDYDVLAGRWTSPDYSIWPKMGKDPSPFNLYMFKNNNPLSDMLDVKNYVTGTYHEMNAAGNVSVSVCGSFL